MARALEILFGAGFTITLAMAAGGLVLRGLGIRLGRVESALFAFLTGSAALSVAVFALCLAGQARPVVFLAAGVPVIAWAAWLRWKDPPAKSLPPAPLAWQTFFYAGLALFAAVYFINALAPEASPDGSGYHLGNVLQMSLRHGFPWDYHTLYFYFPQGMEMLFLVAFSLGGHSSAALVHASFLAALLLLLAAFGRRFGFPRAAMAAGLLVFASPVMGVDGSSAYNDVALATASFAVLYGTQLKLDSRIAKLLLIGILCGFCAALKETGWLILPLAAWWLRRERPWLWLPSGAALAAGPWLLRNWIWLGNPAAPFLNRWFPNPYYYPGPEKSYLADLRHYEAFHHWWQLPVDLAVHGGSISGILGPVFLLAPLALLALRQPLGRSLLAAAAVLALPVYFNSGARFLIPSLPFLALAMGMALQNSWGLLPAVAAFQLWSCWPSTLTAYAAPWSWRIRSVPVQAALRREPEGQFLASRLPDYVFGDAIDRMVPPSQKIFSYAGRPTAYFGRTVVVGYESALGLLVQDILAEAVAGTGKLEFRWTLPNPASNGIRIVARGSNPAWWKVAAVRLWNQGGEVSASGWRFTASPNPWQANLAFTGSPLSFWNTWQGLEAGDYLEADFPQPLAISQVTLEISAVPDAHPLLEVAPTPGSWQAVPDASLQIIPIASRDLRKEAMNQLKMHGIFYLMVNDSDLPAEDLKKHANIWGVTLIQEAHGTRFYRID